MPEMCFWPANTRSNLNFLRCIHIFDLVLKFCADITEVNWLQLVFYVIVLMDMVASVIEMSFSYLFSRFQFEIFSHCSVTETFAFGIQN